MAFALTLRSIGTLCADSQSAWLQELTLELLLQGRQEMRLLWGARVLRSVSAALLCTMDFNWTSRSRSCNFITV